MTPKMGHSLMILVWWMRLLHASWWILNSPWEIKPSPPLNLYSISHRVLVFVILRLLHVVFSGMIIKMTRLMQRQFVLRSELQLFYNWKVTLKFMNYLFGHTGLCDYIVYLPPVSSSPSYTHIPHLLYSLQLQLYAIKNKQKVIFSLLYLGG